MSCMHKGCTIEELHGHNKQGYPLFDELEMSNSSTPRPEELDPQITEVIATYLHGIHHPDEDPLENDLRAMKNTNDLKAAIQAYVTRQVEGELERLSMKVVLPCEPDCDDIRHALHQGSWNAHLVIEERLAALRQGDRS